MIPTPRTDADSSERGVLSIVVESLRRLEDSVARGFGEVNAALSRLPNDYVPRREIERRLDELIIDIGELRRQREADLKEQREATEKAETERSTGRRQLIALACGTAVSAAGVISGIALHFT